MNYFQSSAVHLTQTITTCHYSIRESVPWPVVNYENVDLWM